MFNKKTVSVMILLMLVSFMCFKVSAKEIVYDNSLEYSQSPADNPLTGFVPWAGQNIRFPHSMEYYSFPLSMVQKTYNEFDWNGIEKALNDTKSNGNQAIIRFYMDYPGMETGIPQFLLNNGLIVHEYNLDGQKGLCPDYNDVNLQKALVNFITAFGQKYDGDPRIGFIECGLLGFWGEWHTYPYTDWYPSAELYKIIGKAFDNSFNKTKVMVGESEVSVNDLNIGYHDDMFIKDTEYYAGRLLKNGVNNKWMYEPIGSELAPEIQEFYFEEPRLFVKNEFNDSDIMPWKEAVSLLHTSWCLNNEIDRYEESERENALAAAKDLGYEFTVTKAKVKQCNRSYELNSQDKVDIGSYNDLELSIDIKNVGNAPFYYPWSIETRIADETGKEVARELTLWDITSIKELNKEYVFTHNFSNVNLQESQKYIISIKVVNPMDGGKKLLFANKEQNSDGWLKLIEFTSA